MEKGQEGLHDGENKMLAWWLHQRFDTAMYVYVPELISMPTNAASSQKFLSLECPLTTACNFTNAFNALNALIAFKYSKFAPP
ncbi:hypothetical protein Tco_1299692, partial [Tanacetum coccineum]